MAKTQRWMRRRERKRKRKKKCREKKKMRRKGRRGEKKEGRRKMKSVCVCWGFKTCRAVVSKQRDKLHLGIIALRQIK